MNRNITIVSIDDETINLTIFNEMIEEMGHSSKNFEDASEALEFISQNNVDLILVDYMMPEINGIEVIKKIRETKRDIPIIMITGASGDEELMIKAIKAGATEFINKPVEITEFTARVKNLIDLRIAQLLVADKALLLENEVAKATEKIAKRELETLVILGNAAEYKDPETGDHIQRVSHYCRIISEELGMDNDFIKLIFHASPLHDVGKMAIPDSILLKPRKLDTNEWEIMMTHAQKGYEILIRSESPYLQAGAEIALSHHEKFDGTGYPNKLKGNDIPLMGRITAIADVFDALTSLRPYKEPWSIEKTINLIQEESSKHFDPEIASAFLKRKDDIITTHRTYKG